MEIIIIRPNYYCDVVPKTALLTFRKLHTFLGCQHRFPLKVRMKEVVCNIEIDQPYGRAYCTDQLPLEKVIPKTLIIPSPHITV